MGYLILGAIVLVAMVAMGGKNVFKDGGGSGGSSGSSSGKRPDNPGGE